MRHHKYNRLTLLNKTDKRTTDRRVIFEFKCDCGNTVFLPIRSVRNGNTKSCGCLRREKSAKSVLKVQHLAAKAASIANRKHGLRNTRFYRIWRGMINRCSKKSVGGYKYYGGRGISVCPEWLK